MSGSRMHPETRARGDRSGARTHPEKRPRGENQFNARLTDEAVVDIRSSTETNSEMAKKYGVSQATISGVRLRKTWRHVP